MKSERKISAATRPQPETDGEGSAAARESLPDASNSSAPAPHPVLGSTILERTVVPLGSLKPHPRNYRKHPKDQLDHIKESIRRNGVYRNIVVANDGTILAGHGVAEACGELGLLEVPVVRIDAAPDSPEAMKVLVGDNEIANIGEVDDRRLAEILSEIHTADVGGLAGTGFSDDKLRALVESMAEPEPPNEFKEADENVHTDYECPKCNFKWSGKPS